MTCYHPLVARKVKPYNSQYDPKKKIHILGSAADYLFDGETLVDDEFLIPCGKCIGCRIDAAREWSVRLCHEAETSSSAWFLTMTFDDDHLPEDFSIRKEHVQKFVQNLRTYYYYQVSKDIKLRYFCCGEYGSKGRCHYHMILFNAPIDDLKVQSAVNGNIYYSSDLINSIWCNGFVVIARVCPETTNYVARYTLKKYGLMDLSELGIESPFILMSNRPGIGYEYCVKNADYIYKNASVMCSNGKRASIPKYYLKVLDKLGYDIDKLRVQRKELSFDRQFIDYIHGVDFFDSRQSEESALNSKTKVRGVL